MPKTSQTEIEHRIIEPQGRVIISQEGFDALCEARSALDSLAVQSEERRELYEIEIHANSLLREQIAGKDAAYEALLSTAATATLRADKAETRANRAETDLKHSRDAYRDCLDTLKRALEAANAPMCDSCEGSGNGIRYGFGGPNDETPPELVDEGGCEDCAGLGLSWDI
jgi:hypothetical protein